jgi:hypothetical protein
VPEICHRIGIAALRQRVFEEFATKGGLVEIRTPLTSDPELGGTLDFFVSGTNDPACGLGGGHARRSYRRRLAR